MPKIEIFKLFGSIFVNNDKANQALDTTDQKAKGLAGTFDTVGSRVVSAGKKVSSVGTELTRLAAPIYAAGTAAVKLFSDFEGGMANVATLIGANAGPRVEQLGEDIKNLAVESGKNLDDLTNGLYQVISAFGDNEESSERLEIAVKAATAGVASTVDAVNLLSAVTKGYGDTSAESMRKVSDLAFQTVVLGQTTFPELAGSIGRVTPLAAQLGVSVEELFGYFATLTGVTGDANEVSTQTAAIMRAMMKPTTDMAAAIDQLGYSSAGAMLEELGLTGSLRALMSTTDGTEEAVGKLFGRAEALTAVFALAGGQADVFDEKLRVMYESAGRTEEAFRIQQQTLGVMLNQLKQQFAVLMVDLGQQFVPLVTEKLVPALRSLGGRVKGLIEWYSNLSPAGQTAINMLIGFTLAVGPVIAIVGKFITIGGYLVQGVGKIGMAFSWLAANPVGLIVMAIGALIAIGIALYKNWDKVKEFAKSIWDAITSTIKGAIDGITGWINGMIDKVRGAIDWVKNLLGLNKDAKDTMPASAPATPTPAQGELNFGGGGIVPGPIGAPILITAHGGERVLTPEQQLAQSADIREVIINVYQTISDRATADYALDGLFRRARQLGVPV